MKKELKEYRIKELKSRKKWEKIENGFWFMTQTFMLSMGLYIAIVFFISDLGLEVKNNYVSSTCLLGVGNYAPNNLYGNKGTYRKCKRD